MNTATQTANNLIRVYWTNHEYFASEQFATIKRPTRARSIGFRATFGNPAGDRAHSAGPSGAR